MQERYRLDTAVETLIKIYNKSFIFNYGKTLLENLIDGYKATKSFRYKFFHPFKYKNDIIIFKLALIDWLLYDLAKENLVCVDLKDLVKTGDYIIRKNPNVKPRCFIMKEEHLFFSKRIFEKFVDKVINFVYTENGNLGIFEEQYVWDVYCLLVARRLVRKKRITLYNKIFC